MKGVLLDTNLLCLLSVGRVDRIAVGAHPRLSRFDLDDMVMLDEALDRLGELILCPQVLAETSNLLAYRQSLPQQARWRASLADLVRLAEEWSIASMDVIEDADFLHLGLTDAVLMMLSRRHDLTLLSDDLPLCLAAQNRRLRCLNFNYLRDGAIRLDQL